VLVSIGGLLLLATALLALLRILLKHFFRDLKRDARSLRDDLRYMLRLKPISRDPPRDWVRPYFMAK
ncbi:MAG TPA: hypothetical protein VK786_03990, partial [bacterium]|nr:hypothetical protein [bacterium]